MLFVLISASESSCEFALQWADSGHQNIQLIGGVLGARSAAVVASDRVIIPAICE